MHFSKCPAQIAEVHLGGAGLQLLPLVIFLRAQPQDFNHGLLPPKLCAFLWTKLPLHPGFTDAPLSTLLSSHPKFQSSGASTPAGERARPSQTSTVLLLRLIFISLLHLLKYVKSVSFTFPLPVQNPSISPQPSPLLLCPYGTWLK